MTDKVKITQNDFMKATADLQELQDLLQEHSKEMQSKYSHMGAGWKGLAGAAFAERSHAIIERLATDIAGLKQLVADIEQVRRTLSEADGQLTQTLTQSFTQ